MNKVILTGTVGKYGYDVKEYGKGQKKSLLCNFQLCVRTGYGENATYGYYNCTLFNVSDKFELPEGKHVAISGALKQHIWKDKDGKDHYDTNIIVDSLDFLPDFPKKEETNNRNSNSRSRR